MFYIWNRTKVRRQKNFVGHIIYTVCALTLLVSSCGSDPKTFVPQNVDNYLVHTSDFYRTADSILQAEYVFVLDVSRSMNSNSIYDYGSNKFSKKDNFLANLSHFMLELETNGTDYRLAVINGNTHSTNPSRVKNNFITSSWVDRNMSADQKNNFLITLNNAARPLSEDLTLGLETSYNVMNNVRSSFLRPGSQLVYIFVSDSDDESASTFGSSGRLSSDYATKLLSFKASADHVSARAIVAGYSSGCEPNKFFFNGEDYGTKFAQTASIIEGYGATENSVSSCVLTNDFPQQLKQLANDVRKPEKSFALRATSIEPSSIEVLVNGTAIPTTTWNYNSSSNSVEIIPGYNLQKSSQVEIKYTPYYQLSRTPENISNAVVKVNGISIPQSSSNGWSYNSSFNRIEINGSYKPLDGQSVSIDYK